MADAALHHKVFHQPSNGIVGEHGDDGGIHSKAALQATGDVVFAATLPHFEMTSGRNALIARVEAQHNLAQAHQVPGALAFRFNVQVVHVSG